MKKNDRVRFVRAPSNTTFNGHFELAKEYLDLGKLYTVEHVYTGDTEQMEVVGIEEVLFLTEMFDVVEA